MSFRSLFTTRSRTAAGTGVDRSAGRADVVLVEFSPSGGLFQFAYQLGDALAGHGDRVVLLTGPSPEFRSRRPGFEIRPVLPTWHPTEDAETDRIRRLGRRAVRAARLATAWLVVARELRRRQPDLVLWSYWRFVLDAAAVVLIRRLLPASRLGIVAHEPLPKSDYRDSSAPKSGPVLTRVFDAAWRGMDVVYVLGERTGAIVRAHWRPRGPVVVIPHGDEDLLLAGAAVRPAEETGPCALFFGTWTTYKGIDVLLDAFALVRERVPEATLVVAGAVGGDVDADAFRARAAGIGRVRLVPGYVPAAEVPALFDEARLVVLPYVRATQSGVAHLAYSCSRPVVATDVGDVGRTVLDGRTGRVVPPGDPARLAEVMVELLSDPGLAGRFGAAGRRRADDEHSWVTVAARVREGAGFVGWAEDRGHTTSS